jgi:BirA family biotin operon repressor/biotin-[acetyl-CoA-carboxylase] ligase
MNTADAILDMLRDKGKVSGEAIANRLKVSRTAVWKAINTLREVGYVIEGDAKGYVLTRTPDLLLPQEVNGLLATKTMGRRIEHHYTIGSTNERARQLAEEGCPEGTLVISEVQETGKGRIGRSWVSPKGGIWMSLVLKPDIRPRDAPVLTLAGGVAVTEALSRIGVQATLKWPNDVLVNERKVCGILTEMSGEMERVHYIVMGFGLNANFPLEDLPSEIRSRSTTLRKEMGEAVERKRLVADIMKGFEAVYGEAPSSIIERWKRASSTIGRTVQVVTKKGFVKGLAKDLDGTGALIVRDDAGQETTVYSGDCQHLSGLPEG